MYIVTLDFETFWCSKTYTLSKMGPIEYIRDPRFKVQLLGIRIDRNPVAVFEGEHIATVLHSLCLDKRDRMIVAHNLNGFDALILSEIYGVRPYWMFDTMAAARWTGISRYTSESHAALTTFLETGVKTQGTVISDGKQWPQDFSPQERAQFKQYCTDDVMQCSENFFKMMEFCTADSARSASLTARMATEPMLWFDQDLLESYLVELEERTSLAWADLAKVFQLESKEAMLNAIRSPKIFPQMLRKLGVEPPVKLSVAKTKTARAKLEADWAEYQKAAPSPGVVQRINSIMATLAEPEDYAVYTPAMSKTDLDFIDLQNHPDPRVALLVSTRLEQNSSILRSRTERFLTLAKHNKPVPVMLQVFKAHTSRYTAGNEGTSDGTQFQNLNKRDRSQLTLRRAIKPTPGYKIVSGDSSQIEARMLAYIAGEQWLLESFRNGEDPYSQQAERAAGIPWQEIKAGAKAGDPKMEMWRHVGKTCVLSCGYQVGAKKFSDTLLRGGVKLHEDLDKHYELAKHAHSIYRMSNPAIVDFWRRCQLIIAHLHIGGGGQFGGPLDNIFTYGTMGILGDACVMKVPSIAMPSGFILRYPGLEPARADTGAMEYHYDRQRGRSVVKTKIYGGSLTENLIQGISFQLLQWQACRMDEEQIPLKYNIHDAYGAVVKEEHAEETKKRMEYWMSQVPPWLPGFPVACEVKIGDDFTIA